MELFCGFILSAEVSEVHAWGFFMKFICRWGFSFLALSFMGSMNAECARTCVDLIVRVPKPSYAKPRFSWEPTETAPRDRLNPAPPDAFQKMLSRVRDKAWQSRFGSPTKGQFVRSNVSASLRTLNTFMSYVVENFKMNQINALQIEEIGRMVQAPAYRDFGVALWVADFLYENGNVLRQRDHRLLRDSSEKLLKYIKLILWARLSIESPDLEGDDGEYSPALTSALTDSLVGFLIEVVEEKDYPLEELRRPALQLLERLFKERRHYFVIPATTHRGKERLTAQGRAIRNLIENPPF